MRFPASPAGRLLAASATALLAACADRAPVAPHLASPDALRLECSADVPSATLTCTPAGPALGNGARGVYYGGQGTLVQLASSGFSRDAGTGEYAFDVTVTNLLGSSTPVTVDDQAIGTVDGVTPDTAGIKVFFHSGPTATQLADPAGPSEVSVAGDGRAIFTGSGPDGDGQPYFRWSEIVASGATSSARRWSFTVPANVTRFAFTVYVATEAQARIVINEIMPNPAGTVQDSVGEYVEVYNAGRFPVRMTGFILRDNTAGVADTVKTALVVANGGYALLGRSGNTSKNGGITPDYLYTWRVGSTSTSLSFSNSGSDFFVVRAPTGVTVDSVSYISGTTTAVAGVARELKNPALDNTMADGANWGAATAVYDPAVANNNRGTPRQQNSVFTP